MAAAYHRVPRQTGGSIPAAPCTCRC